MHLGKLFKNTTVKGQIVATTKVDNTIRFGTVSDTKEMKFAGTDIIVKEMDIVEGDWTVQDWWKT